MSDYKVLVGKTKFPLKAPKGNEANVVQGWDKVYENIRNERANDELFVLHDGPPYANGDIHIGHALNKIIKDITVRYQLMLGKNVHYQPGWDCHGLPIEWKVEEEYRKKGMNKDEDIISFREDCRKYAQEWLEKQREQFKVLGIIGEWDNPYSTMNFESEAKIVEKLHTFAMNDMIYRDYKPVMWSPVEKTSLAEAEVEYQNIKTETMYVEFPLDGNDSTLSLVIWTTTPWTLPGNRAIAYSPNITYVKMNTKVNGKQKNLVLAENLVEDFCKISGLINEGLVTYDVTKHWGAVHPIYKTIRPLLPADFVKDTTGTGFVHIAPAHGEDDFQLGKKHKLLTRSTIDDQGMMTEVLFEGVHVYKGDEAVKNALGEHLIACNTIVHSYPHSWRSKKPVIYKTTPQWFISVEGIREQALNALNDVGFYPAGGRNRITSMIKSRGDWCISRQRAWGVPIMIFLDNNGNILKDDVVNNRIKDTVSALGCDAWFNLPNDFFLHGYKNPNDYTKVMDVLDVWFDSGSTFSFSLNDHLPVDLYLEGSDQHRGWFQSSLLVGVGTIGVAPYKNLLTHGFVLDGNGRKMAKSEGNVVSPNDVISKYGVETLRMWVASSDYTEDLKISMNTVATTNTDMLGKIRNTLRFIIMNLNDNKVVDTVPYKDLPELEKLMLLQVYELDKRLREYLCNYEYHKIVSDIHRFCVNNLSSYYFTMKKDSLYCDAENSISRRACLTVLDVCFKYLTGWLSPIIPFTIDEITQLRYNCKSGEYFHKILETCPEEWNTYNNVYKWQQLDIIRNRILSEIEKLRTNKVVGSSYEVVLKTYLLEDLDTTGINLLDFFGVSKIETSASIELVVQKIDGEKCPRCWTYHDYLINDVCPRCDDVLMRMED